MDQNCDQLQNSLISIASELFRIQKVFEKAIGKLELDEQKKYASQFSWFSKKVMKAIEEANLKIVNLEGQLYDPGMAVTPLNLEDFDTVDTLFITQIIEPIIMQNGSVIKTGIVLLGRTENE